MKIHLPIPAIRADRLLHRNLIREFNKATKFSPIANLQLPSYCLIKSIAFNKQSDFADLATKEDTWYRPNVKFQLL